MQVRGQARWSVPLSLGILALFILCSVARAGGPAEQVKEELLNAQASVLDDSDYHPNRLLVKVKEHVSPRMMASVQAELGASVVKQFKSVRGLQRFDLPRGRRAKEALALLQQCCDDMFEYIEFDGVARLQVDPNDTWYKDLQWNLHNTGQGGGTPGADIDAPSAWDLTTGDRRVVVAVIDSGIDGTHPDLYANLWTNPGEICGNGLDDDHNGFDDDCHGISTYRDNSDTSDVSELGHGTHVAGIIGALGNNRLGVTGVAWQVSIMPCGFTDPLGSGYVSDAIECFDYVAMMKDRGVADVVATNHSWATSASYQALRDAIEAHLQRGILTVAAAGNRRSDNDVSRTVYPANIDWPNVIAVAATTKTDALADSSNFGRYTVSLGAPGDGILSTVPRNLDPVYGGYTLYSGTSMAAPHVAGVAALLKANMPWLDWKAIKNRILAGSDPNLALVDKTISGGRLNAHRALTCTNTTVLSRLTPTGASLVGLTGDPIQLSVLHINCDQSNGEVTVQVDPPGEQVVLYDDGQGPDQEPNDGIYTGQWTPTAGGTFTLAFPDGSVVPMTVTPQYHYEEVPFRWRTIDGTYLSVDNDETRTIPTPFLIRFAGARFPTLRGNSNGILWPGEGSLIGWLSAIHEPLPTRQLTTSSRPFIFPFWTDFYPIKGSAQNVSYAVLGAPPNRMLVVQWSNVRHSDCRGDGAATVTFQVVLSEAVDDIEFNYRDVHFGGACSFADGGGSATIGVQITSQLATQLSYNTQSLWNNMTLLFKWPGFQTGSVRGGTEAFQTDDHAFTSAFTRWPTIPHIPDPE